MSENRSGQKQGSGCLALLLILTILVDIPVISFAVTQKPFNYPLILVVLASFALLALAATPGFRRLRQRFPSAAGFILTLAGTCIGIGIASIPFQNFLLLLILAIPVALLLFALISWVAQRKLARAESARRNMEHSESGSASREYQSIVLARFLGLTIKYAQYGRFSILSLSDKDE